MPCLRVSFWLTNLSGILCECESPLERESVSLCESVCVSLCLCLSVGVCVSVSVTVVYILGGHYSIKRLILNIHTT